MIDQLHCPMSYAVYKFQPELLEFTACCDAKNYSFDIDAFDELGTDYFEKFPKLVQRKKDLYDNIRNSDCDQCWKKEEQNLPSMRQSLAYEYPELLNNRTLKVEKAYVNRIELWMRSTCNLGCFMCHLGNSNTLRKIWYTDYDTHGINGHGYEKFIDALYGKRIGIVDEFKNRIIDFTIRQIQQTNSSMLTIAYLGGEPTLHDDMYEHTDLFINAGKDVIKSGKELCVTITTNGTSKDKLNLRFFTMFEKYKSAGWKTKISLSQDGADDISQVRWGANFNQIRRNFGNWIREDSPVDEMTSFTVVSNLNLPYMNEMAEYIDYEIENNYDGITKKCNITFNVLIQPDWMQVKYLPKSLAYTSILRAQEIFKSIDEKYPLLYYQRGLFDNIVNSLRERPDLKDVEYFFSKLDYVNSVYKKTDSNWNFYKIFPHLNKLRTMYGIET